ncbi:MAG: CGNR zinc finger domain-containing protein [Candidatus Cybelea sp.]|jgi:predicted RNA-binding Zn ribbon-like protein
MIAPVQPEPDRAPGALDLVRQFENTVELPNGPDELGSLEEASAWCRGHGLAAVKNERHLRLLRAFREAVREVLYANNGEGDAGSGWAALKPFLAAAHLSLEVNPEEGLELRPVSEEDAGPIASLLAIVYKAQVRGTWSRLRACRKASCRFAYYDQTKNASRAWCSMATCGNQAKAQRRRERARNAMSS